ncbi:MAG: glycosyltransferase family 2 protein [Candidatus Ancaeobacter aquaticus]|nr:glycosyltransferase family 2 protein [Candidatus Ancaeobacter aquaticus]
MKVCVLVPVYNEENHLRELLDGVKTVISDIIVVDDGSTDKSSAVAESAGVHVIRHETNSGKGAALKSGFDYVSKGDWDAVITIDGDGQHDYNEINTFIDRAGEADILIGNRLDDTKSMPIIRLWTNQFTSNVVSKIAGQKIPDSQCGFRLFHKRVLGHIDLKTVRFDSESEILINASQKGYTIASVPVRTIYGTEESKICPSRDVVLFFKLVFKSLYVSKKKKK